MRRAELVLYANDIERIALQIHWRDAAYHSRPANNLQGQPPFAIATPLGLRRRVGMLATLRSYGIDVTATREIPDWAATATRLYLRGRSPRALAQAAAYEQLWRSRYQAQSAEVWELAGVDAYVRFLRQKPELQNEFPDDVIAVGIHMPGEAFRFTAYLRAFHLPDPQNLATERWLLPVPER
jgi:hypothetical protein